MDYLEVLRIFYDFLLNVFQGRGSMYYEDSVKA